MKKHNRRFIIFTAFLICFSCSNSEEDDITVGDTRTIEDLHTDFNNLNLQTGINDVTIESLNRGVFWNFRVIIPEGASESNTRPLVMALHGASGGSPTAHQNTSCYVEPGLQDLEAIIISPNAGVEQWYSIGNQMQVINLIQLAQANLFVDSSKVLVMGYSNGGNASWLFADFFSQYFTASMPLASSYNPRRADGSISSINVPMYVIHSDSDELFPLEITQGYVDDSIGAGSQIEFVIADGLSHYSPCDYVSYIQQGVVWLQTQIWN